MNDDLTRVARVRAVAWFLAALLVAAVATAEPARRQTTINGLVVRELGAGQFSGQAVGIVATVERAAPTAAPISILGAIGPEMNTALQTAHRYACVLHPKLAERHVVVSFEEKYSPKDGGSAGAAFAILLRSLMEGFDIDANVAITGDLADNGKLQPIGGVVAKLRGAGADGCTIVIVPVDNSPAVSDLLVRADRVNFLKSAQVIAAVTVDDAVAIARAQRSDKHAEAVRVYGEVQQALGKSGLAALRDPAVMQKLARVLELAPNHLSALHARDIGQGKGPRTYTRTGSVVQTIGAARPLWELFATRDRIVRADLPTAKIREMRLALIDLQRYTHPDVEPLRRNMLTWLGVVDKVLGARGPLNDQDIAVIVRHRDALLQELRRLDTDEELVGKMLREGY